MADSVDRVFVHALNTVKRIPRLGSARPPPAERLKLYGLYKQSMEGDVDGVMDRPGLENGSGKGVNGGTSISDELRSDQQKWDAWNAQRGVSRTEAKRRYITTLLDTMRTYASQTADARELVSELEFVWDQIKSNPSSDKSQSSGRSHSDSNPNSTSYSPGNRQSGSPPSSSDPVIYPVMSERGASNPRTDRSRKRGREAMTEGTDDRGLRVLSPISQGDVGDYSERETDGEEAEGGDRERQRFGEEDDTDALEGDDFVDAPDSQIADGDRGSQHYTSSGGEESPASPTSPARARPAAAPEQQQQQQQQQRSAASAIIDPIAKYIQKQRQPTSTAESTARWQRRIESALVKINTEMAALREQLDMQQHGGGSVYSSIALPFSGSRRNSYAASAAGFGGGGGGAGGGRGRRGIVMRVLGWVTGFTDMLVKHLVIDALVLALITLWMHYRGIPPERLEELISSWIRGVRSWALFRRLERVTTGETKIKLPRGLRRLTPGVV